MYSHQAAVKPRPEHRARVARRPGLRCFVAALVAIGAAGVGMPASVVAAAGPSATFIVNAAGDGADVANDGVCQTATPGECTLRAALTESNRAALAAVINFNIPGAGVHQIAPGTALPQLNNPLGITIDGFTQPGSSPNTDPLVDNAVRTIELKGKGGHGIDGIFMSTPNNTIRGLNVHAFNHLVWLFGPLATNNLIVGNSLGLTPAGDYDPTYTLIASSSCVTLQGTPTGPSHNSVGTPALADRNTISGCNHLGVAIYNFGSDYNLVQNNIIGLDPTGTQRRGSISHGVDVNSGAQHNLVGGSGLNEGNVLSGNFQDGVELSHFPSTRYNAAIGNRIGTDPSGNSAPQFAQNGQWGVHLEGFADCLNAPCPEDAGFNSVVDNIIVNSLHGGIMVDKGVHDSLIAHNKIGVTANGTPAGNGLFGINVNAGSVRNTIGPDNEIAWNEQALQMQANGVEPPNSTPSVTNRNTITQNSIHDNSTLGVAALGIDFPPFGKASTLANADPNVNDAILPPTLSNPQPVTVDVTTCPNCTIELFVADRGVFVHGSGKTYLATATADSAGFVQMPVPASAIGLVVTATATNANGSTSEFSRNVLIPTSHQNVPPTAAFSVSCTLLKCQFDGTASSDADGSIATYRWNFGDGHTAQGVTATHDYATESIYVATLTVTDDLGATGNVTHNAVADNFINDFQTGPAVNVNGTYTPLSGDFNDDGRNDILWYAPGTAHDVLWLASNTTPGRFIAGPAVTVNGTYKPLVGNFDGLNGDDILWYAPGTAHDVLWLATSGGHFTGGPAVNVNGTYKPLVGNFDGLNGDDILWYAPGSGGDVLWLASATTPGRFTGGPATNVNGTYTPVVGNFDGLNGDDILWYAPGSGGDVLWLASATTPGRFTGGPATNVNGTYLPVSGDYNGDSRDDILWYAPGTGGDVLWLASPSTPGRFTGGSAISVVGPYIPVPGDYTGDTRTDILWYAPGTAHDELWLAS